MKDHIEQQASPAHYFMCPHSCSADNLNCGKDQTCLSEDFSEDETRRHGHGGSYGRCGHGRGRDGHGSRSGEPCRHGGHGHPPFPDDGSLQSLFARCSHALRRGGRHLAQERVLRILAQRETEEVGQRQLQELLGVQSGSLSELVSKLEDKGLLVRIRNETDKRNVTLRLTEAGRARAARPSDRPDPFAALSETEQEELRALLQKVLDSQEKDRRPHAAEEHPCD